MGEERDRNLTPPTTVLCSDWSLRNVVQGSLPPTCSPSSWSNVGRKVMGPGEVEEDLVQHI